jgi:hypothetical protein
MPQKNGDTNYKKNPKIGDLIMNNNAAPNNVLVGVTWICSSKLKLAALLTKIYSISYKN